MNQLTISNLNALQILQLLFPSKFLLFQCLRASNAYLQFLLGPATEMLFEFVNEMPKLETQIKIDLTSVLGPLFFTWVILQLFPEDVICFILIYGNNLQLFSLFMYVILTSLVYEKQQKLRIMMKMHGLGDDPYWMITYAYFLVIYLVYMLCFVVFGLVIGLKFFTLNDYTIQFVFYFIYVNLQISLAFLVASIFANVKIAAGIQSLLIWSSLEIQSFHGSNLR
ncbi:ABC transporter A family member 7 [Camellia lanceoleosa]|uniref:ABC transporter A family member 7 n=1 Tax=Camellia lanceoleosa TaxID=1840588 RepID=A0ACC0IBP3_9ERIC|nr:ABC transporter A family member 7 [Camellia lanceoleosa]